MKAYFVFPFIIFSLFAYLSQTNAQASTLPSTKDLQEFVLDAQAQFNTPGVAITVVKNNDILLQQGYGIADVSSKRKVNDQTLFRIASLSKAFTSAAMAVLVEQNKIDWNDKVIEHLPSFALYDPQATRQFKIIDLFTHKSGLVSGAGDSMIWPAPTKFTRDDIVHNLRFLKPEYDFRERYAYSNVMYIVAGAIINKVSGMSYAEFVKQHIFEPLNMACYAGKIPQEKIERIAKPYGYNDTEGVFEISRNTITSTSPVDAAAGAIVCDIESMTQWAKAWAKPELLPFSHKQYTLLTQSHTLMQTSSIESNWLGALFKHYGLGWRISNIGRYQTVSHTGTISGYQSYMLNVPELQLSIVIMNNGSHSGLRGSIMYYLLEHLLGNDNHLAKQASSWIKKYQDYFDEREKIYLENLAEPVVKGPMTIETEDIEGSYNDQWFGSFTVSTNEHNTTIKFDKMPSLFGQLTPFHDSTYRIEWFDKNAAGKALIVFDLDFERSVKSATIHPFTLKKRSNHNFQDMLFYKVN